MENQQATVHINKYTDSLLCKSTTSLLGEYDSVSESYTASEVYKFNVTRKPSLPIIRTQPQAESESMEYSEFGGAFLEVEAEATVQRESVDYTPSITAEPEDTACAQNEEVTLRVAATGAGTLTYQWYEVAGETKTAIENATEAEYRPSTAEVGEKSYCCVVTNTVDGTAYTATSREAKVTVRKSKIEIVADMKIVAGTYSSTNSEWYRDALNGEFSRGKTDYDIRITDEGYKIFFALSDAAKGAEVHYEISYNGSVGTGRGDTGILALAANGMTQPIMFNEYVFAVGKTTEASIRVGTLGEDGWDSYETYTFRVEYTCGLRTVSVSANDASVELTPSKKD